MTRLQAIFILMFLLLGFSCLLVSEQVDSLRELQNMQHVRMDEINHILE